ncbi:myelin transcription factor 1-like protein [Ostrea edulis]|uniref:myelin transcription factor 1-like protein n=1 Tax=Ostrea edulis TaxID=37623 RepID=UPI0020941263|nr:myelin transcription factor 1-like protein [Ostrea edulis]
MVSEAPSRHHVEELVVNKFVAHGFIDDIGVDNNENHVLTDGEDSDDEEQANENMAIEEQANEDLVIEESENEAPDDDDDDDDDDEETDSDWSATEDIGHETSDTDISEADTSDTDVSEADIGEVADPPDEDLDGKFISEETRQQLKRNLNLRLKGRRIVSDIVDHEDHGDRVGAEQNGRHVEMVLIREKQVEEPVEERCLDDAGSWHFHEKD